MIDFLSTYTKGIAVCIVIVSILEMLVPDSKSKKYIKTIFGVFIIYTIVNPLIKNKEIFNVNEILETNLSSVEFEETKVNQTSMNNKIKTLYIQEIEKDIKEKIEEKGYIVDNINVEATVEDKAKIVGVSINLNKDSKNSKNSKEESIENKLVSEVNKIKKISIDKGKKKTENNENQNNEFLELKKYISEEYGVDVKCLKIN